MEIDAIHEEITIEELAHHFPLAVRFLMEKGIRCLRCGEPIWSTLREAAIEKGYSENAIPFLVDELKAYLRNG